MKNRSLFCISVVLLCAAIFAPHPCGAVDGVSISEHWENSHSHWYGGYGNIWKHVIDDNEVVSNLLIYEGSDARNPRFSSDAALVAFVRKDGKICVVPTEGGEVKELADGHPEGSLDWPEGPWIYYSLGGYDTEGAANVWRVDWRTGESEHFMTFTAEDRVIESWRFDMSLDGSRIVVRTGTKHPNSKFRSRIFAVEAVKGGGELTLDRATELDRNSCQEAMLADGDHFFDGWPAHDGTDVRRFEDMEIVASFDWRIFPEEETGISVNRINGSANSDRWVCLNQGFVSLGKPGSNQVLFNWKEEKRIVVTSNVKDSNAHDGAGDFWVGDYVPNQAPVVELISPSSRQLLQEEEPFTLVADAVDYDGEIVRVEFFSSGEKIGESREPPFEVQVDGLSIGGYTFAAVATDDKLRSAESRPLFISVVDEDLVPPRVELSSPRSASTVTEGETVFIAIETSDDDGEVVRVELLDDGECVENLVAEPFELAWKPLAGEHIIQARAIDNDGLSALSDAVSVFVQSLSEADELEEPSSANQEIFAHSPVKDGVYRAGSHVPVHFTTQNLADVTLYFSADGGETWENLFGVDDSSHLWGYVPLKLPWTETGDAMMLITGYFGEAPREVGPFRIEPSNNAIRVKSPRLGERFTAGSEIAVAWSSDKKVKSVIVELSLDDGLTWQEVAKAERGEGPEVPIRFKAPNAHSRFCRVRLRNRSGKNFDESNVFSIFPQGKNVPSEMTIAIRGAVVEPAGSLLQSGVLRAGGVTQGHDGSGDFEVHVEVPAGVDVFVFPIAVLAEEGYAHRLVRLDIAE